MVTADLDGYAARRDETLAALPGVQRIMSTIVMKRVVDDRPLPVVPHASRVSRARAPRR